MILWAMCQYCKVENRHPAGFYRGNNTTIIHWICSSCNKENEIK